ncbi:MAG: transporter substrate-binding domain-containing protein, partial [Paludibacteraceae bacterium]|nr:transporter substrate-binding domain-containing protein [Paludibacteraceae bacterium]
MRKHLIHILSALLLIGTVTTIIPGCNKDNDDDCDYATQCQPTIERIKQNGVLLVGTTGDYHPLTFLEPDGSYTGFGIEVAEAIAKELGVGIKFVPTSWPALTADVLEEPQKFDLAIGGITITDKRLETMLMSKGYLANGKTILCRRNDADKFKSLEDIDKPEV